MSDFEKVLRELREKRAVPVSVLLPYMEELALRRRRQAERGAALGDYGDAGPEDAKRLVQEAVGLPAACWVAPSQEETPFEGHNCHGCRFNSDGYCHAGQETTDTEAIQRWSWETTYDGFGLPHLDDEQAQTKGCPGFSNE